MTARPLSPGGVLATRESKTLAETGEVVRALRVGDPVASRTGRADDFSWPPPIGGSSRNLQCLFLSCRYGTRQNGARSGEKRPPAVTEAIETSSCSRWEKEMVNQVGNGAPEPNNAPPRFSVLTQYTKDFSFENPNAPRTLAAQQQSPKISLQINVNARQIGPGDFEVSLMLEGGAGEGAEALFKFETQLRRGVPGRECSARPDPALGHDRRAAAAVSFRAPDHRQVRSVREAIRPCTSIRSIFMGSTCNAWPRRPPAATVPRLTRAVAPQGRSRRHRQPERRDKFMTAPPCRSGVLPAISGRSPSDPTSDGRARRSATGRLRARLAHAGKADPTRRPAARYRRVRRTGADGRISTAIASLNRL